MKASSAEADPRCEDVSALRRARIALAAVCEPGEATLVRAIDTHGPSATIAALLAGTGPARGISRSAALGKRLAELDLDALIARGEDLGLRVLLASDAMWPVRLNDLGDRRPIALWCWGEANPRLHTLRSMSMVGARACTRYGEFVARDWSAQLAAEGVAIVSGGAYGIDAAAHRGALAVDGVTVCVLAGGIDVPYPRGHEGLFAEIVEQGLVVSEAPLGETVRRRRFLTRNRLIAALGSVTCVVEAAERSGSARTATDAALMHRPVLAVPGPVTSQTSRGTHQLIADGVATLAGDLEDLRAAIDPIAVVPRSGDLRDPVSRSLREVLDVLPAGRDFGDGNGLGVGLCEADIAVRCGLPAHEVRVHLREALERGLIARQPGDRWVYLPDTCASTVVTGRG